MKKAVLLFSGGLDSSTVLAIAKQQGYACYTLSFNYEQKHSVELEAARQLAISMGALRHEIVSLEIGQLLSSSLTSAHLNVPSHGEEKGIPSTYVPARNTVFLSLALAWAESLGAHDIFIGVNAVDYSGYPDCRPSYMEAFEKMATLATKEGVEGKGTFKIHAPLLHLTKKEIILLGTSLGVDYGKTISCYRADGEGKACGTCDSCYYRKEGFLAANIPDPTPYQRLAETADLD